MQPGSSLRYVRNFNKNRQVWLEGNSLFEVYKHEGSTFRVYLNKAFIEVKGTCFSVKQNNLTQNEIILFNGKIDFNIESTGQKMKVHPLQKITYNPETTQSYIENIQNITWENGRYNFTDIPLTQLIRSINQMYNTNIVLKKNIQEESAFTGSIRYDEPLEDVLEKICFSQNLRLEKNDSEITIY